MFIEECLFSTSENESVLYFEAQRLTLYECLDAYHLTMLLILLWKK